MQHKITVGTVLLTALTLSSADIWFPNYRQSAPFARSLARNSVSPSRRDVSSASGDMMFATEEKNTAWQNHVDKIISKGILKMSLDIEQKLRAESGPNENVLFSPVSIASALALVLLGSGGRTFQETARVMGVATGVEIASQPHLIHSQFGRLLDKFSYAHLISRSNIPVAEAAKKAYDGLELTAASGVFVQDGFTVAPTFRRVATSAYHSDVVSVDFIEGGEGPSKLINGWVSDRTQGHIRDILPWRIAPAWTRVIFATALYFNGAWKIPFPVEGTAPRPFYLGSLPKYVNGFVVKPSNPKPGDVIQVPMMANIGEFPFLKRPDLGFRAFGLPYGLNDSTSPVATMYFVIPNADGNSTGVSGLRNMLNRLKYTDLEAIVTDSQTRPLIVSVPKMKLSSSTSLKQAVSSLGLPSLFDPATANLSGIFEESVTSRSVSPSNYRRGGSNSSSRKGAQKIRELGPLFADDIRHRVELEVTELGTVAAAATSVALSRDGGTHVTIRADRPFLFFVHHVPSNLILFWGSIVRPPVA
ncbi:serine protease inhibitor 28Dc-like [Ischnura elegans]|uniref:serine protease inhibitor 28Dc-like n=1 Tax=Ischnura elegans TaxID=197161 RepID=UPI001ED87A29|nr:serine protease inhibitor 28Dc-like [Ischnura elegans]XP_046400211.1 serine protease inhibitor 28Dc-like [Ischnura elegans]